MDHYPNKQIEFQITSCNPYVPGSSCKNVKDLDNFLGTFLINSYVVESKVDFDVYNALPIKYVNTKIAMF